MLSLFLKAQAEGSEPQGYSYNFFFFYYFTGEPNTVFMYFMYFSLKMSCIPVFKPLEFQWHKICFSENLSFSKWHRYTGSNFIHKGFFTQSAVCRAELMWAWKWLGWLSPFLALCISGDPRDTTETNVTAGQVGGAMTVWFSPSWHDSICVWVPDLN